MYHFNNNQAYIKIDLEDFEKKFQHEIQYFKNYFELNHENLSLRKRQLDDALKTDIEQNPNYESFIRNIYYLDYVKTPSYFYHSSIVFLYSFLEDDLNNICDKIQTDTGLPIGVNDIGGASIIQKARIFLSKFAQIDFAVLDKEWKKITDYQKLRNIIVHQNSHLRMSELDGKKSEQIRVVKKFKNIEIDNENQAFYIVKAEILIEFIELIETFVRNIVSQIADRDFKKFDFVSKRDDFLF